MFARLQQKWKLSPWGLGAVLLCFAIGGSLCGWASRQLLALTGLQGGGKWVAYVVFMTLTWPFCVLAVGHLLGQGRFFRNYLLKIFRRMIGVSAEPAFRLAIFASGGGSNARVLMDYFANHPQIKICLLASNRAGAGALALAAERSMDTMVLDRKQLAEHGYVQALKDKGITHIVLAGFLLKVPPGLVAAYANAIVNIHPALLPRFGGKGMFGHHVHEAVLAAGETESGITIHLVDEQYDHGGHLFQASCPVVAGDTAEILAARVLHLEHSHYAPVVEQWLMGTTKGR